MVARIVSHHDCGTGGWAHSAGSLRSPVCVGTTIVPSGPSTDSSASTTATAPPQTQPRLDNEVCTSTVSPVRSPSRSRSTASDSTVTGANERPTAFSSGIQPLCKAALVSRVLITGMSGAGKSTLLHELNGRGHCVLDTDYDGWVGADGRWDEARMERFLASTESVVVSGTVENQGMFYPAFDHVVLLSAPLPVLLERVQARRDNPYGQSQQDLDEIRQYVAEVEPLLRSGASSELDGRRPVAELADVVEQLLHDEPPKPPS